MLEIKLKTNLCYTPCSELVSQVVKLLKHFHLGYEDRTWGYNVLALEVQRGKFIVNLCQGLNYDKCKYNNRLST